MKRFTTILLLLFCGLPLLQAQQQIERWQAADYFPKNHFVRVYNDGEVDDDSACGGHEPMPCMGA